MNVITMEDETSLEKYVRYGLVPESDIPEGMRRIAQKTRRDKAAEAWK